MTITPSSQPIYKFRLTFGQFECHDNKIFYSQQMQRKIFSEKNQSNEIGK